MEKHPDEPWAWDVAYGKRERRAKRGGIDLYRYGQLILERKLLSFVFSYQNEFSETLI